MHELAQAKDLHTCELNTLVQQREHIEKELERLRTEIEQATADFRPAIMPYRISRKKSAPCAHA